MAPGLVFGDGAEFQTLAASGGLSHGPGYAVYLFFLKLVNLLPFATTAYKANLASGLAGAAGVATIFLLARALGTRRIYCFFAGFALAFHWLYWWHSIMAEVYTISVATLLALLLFAVLWKRTRSLSYLMAGGIVGGLSLGLHPTVLICSPLIFLYLLLNKATKPEWKTVLAAIVAGLAIAVLAFMVCASYDGPTTNTNSIRYSASAFGMRPADFDSPLVRVWFELSLRQFRTILSERPAALGDTNSGLYMSWLLNSIGIVASLIGALGAVWIFLKKPARLYVGWREGVLVVGAFAVLTVFCVRYYAPDIEVFFLPSQAVLIVMLPAGLQGIESALHRFRSRVLPSTRLASWPAVVTTAIACMGALPECGPLLSGVQAGQITFLTGVMRRNPLPVDQPDLPHKEAEAVATVLEDNALVLDDWDKVYAILYVTNVEENRPNIEVVEFTPAPGKRYAATSMLQALKDAYPIRPIYTKGVARSLVPYYDFYQVPADVPLFRLAVKGQRPPVFARDGTRLDAR